MKRRQFIKSTSLATLALTAMPISQCSPAIQPAAFQLMQSLKLKGFNDEQEESPVLVTNGADEHWLFSLRRFGYPLDEEVIACFYNDGKEWNEMQAVTPKPGHYEAPTAVCAPGGTPIIAWTEIIDDSWNIVATAFNTKGSNQIHTFKGLPGNSINPVLVTSTTGKTWLAWEQLYQGTFSIYVSNFENNNWSAPIAINKDSNSCFDPALALAPNGDLHVAYGLTNGFHQDIEMRIIDGITFKTLKEISIATGGARKNRVNINCKPALAFDTNDRLWISYENNKNASRLDDGDNYTGDRCCAILCYTNNALVEVESNNKWLFEHENDHKPTFVKDANGNLFLATHCGGTFENPYWRYRIAWLDPENGWQAPITLLETKVKGAMIPPALSFDTKGNFWFATCIEKLFDKEKLNNNQNTTRARLSQLEVMQYRAPEIANNQMPIRFVNTQVQGHVPDATSISTLSGHPRTQRIQKVVDGETYTLIYGNLHEHSNSSDCWPAGTDGSLHDDYRFGMFTENYDFFGMTDHASSTTELYWRKSIRLADFYNESQAFVAIPAIEWTLQSDPDLNDIEVGSGHYNIVFASTEDAKKYVRNEHEIYCPRTPEANYAPALWELLSEKKINCVTIPHHPADETHPMDWNVTNPYYVPIVEIFQCRGNNEYPGCPREINLERHNTTTHKKAFIDYALKAKKHQLGFIASGDHNSMGVGLAALWVKEISRAGIMEALRSKRTFATTGDKMRIDIQLSNTQMGTIATKRTTAPTISISAHGQYPLKKVELLRNSIVIETFSANEALAITTNYKDLNFQEEKEVLYYYARATQLNGAIAWSSPIWVELS